FPRASPATRRRSRRTGRRPARADKGAAALMRDVVLQTSLPGFPQEASRKGKVRDIYDLGDRLLIIATDRISAFDVVLPTGIPFKGEVLTRLSAFWFAQFSRIRHHLLELVEDVAQASRLWPYRRD